SAEQGNVLEDRHAGFAGEPVVFDVTAKHDRFVVPNRKSGGGMAGGSLRHRIAVNGHGLVDGTDVLVNVHDHEAVGGDERCHAQGDTDLHLFNGGWLNSVDEVPVVVDA